MRGRPPKPTRLKKLEGTFRKDREKGGTSLEPPPAVPACPSWIKGEAKAEWDRVVPQLAELGVLTGLDGGALERYCSAHGNWLRAQRSWAKLGDIVKTPFGPQKNPAVKIAQDERKEASRLGGLLGLDPSGRVRLKTQEKPESADPTEAFLFSGPKLVKPA